MALADYENNPVVNELMARTCFIMENFTESVYHNKVARKLNAEDPIKLSNNESDIGLARYRMCIMDGNEKLLHKAFSSFRTALEHNPDNINAMVNFGLVYKYQEQAQGK